MTGQRAVEFRGATAVVTGGASGIGEGIARALRSVGSNVVIADVDETALEATSEALGALGVVTDVTDPDSVARLAERTLEAYGAVHLVCNNAGVGPFGSIAEMTLDDWRFVLDVNLRGVLHGIHAFLPLLERNDDWGHVVNTSSMAAITAPAQVGAYVASKAAVLGLTEVLSAELSAAGSLVGATALLPGTVRTNIKHSLRTRRDSSPTGLHEVDLEERRRDARWLDPEEVGQLVLGSVRRNELYCLTHPELAPQIEARFRRIVAAAGSSAQP